MMIQKTNNKIFLCFFILFFSFIYCDICPNTYLNAVTPSFDFQLCSQYQDNACCRTTGEAAMWGAWQNAVANSGLCNYYARGVRPLLIDYYCMSCDPSLSDYFGSWPDWHNVSGFNVFVIGTPDVSLQPPCTTTPNPNCVTSVAGSCVVNSTSCVTFSSCNRAGCVPTTCVTTITANTTCSPGCNTVYKSSNSCSSDSPNAQPFVIMASQPTYFFCNEFLDELLNIQSNGDGTYTSDYDACGIQSNLQGIAYPSQYFINGATDYNSFLADFVPGYSVYGGTGANQAGLVAMSQADSMTYSLQNATLDANWTYWSNQVAYFVDQWGNVNPTPFAASSFPVTYPKTCFYPTSFGISIYSTFSIALLIVSFFLSMEIY